MESVDYDINAFSSAVPSQLGQVTEPVNESVSVYICLSVQRVFFVVILVRYKAIYKSDHKQSISQWTAYLKLQDNVQQWI